MKEWAHLSEVVEYQVLAHLDTLPLLDHPEFIKFILPIQSSVGFRPLQGAAFQILHHNAQLLRLHKGVV